MTDTNIIPRRLWIYWAQGWDHAPPIVRACLRSWLKFNDGWEINVLDDLVLKNCSAYSELVDLSLKDKIEIEAFSDILRIELLTKFGGVWADATLFCTRPLDGWLHAASRSSFFAFSRPGAGREISSWFLASANDSPLMPVWRESVRAYWRERSSRDNYFWLHLLFNDIIANNSISREVWSRTVRISADNPHHYLPYQEKIFKDATPSDVAILNSASHPVLKLTHKVDHNLARPSSVYSLLCRWV